MERATGGAARATGCNKLHLSLEKVTSPTKHRVSLICWSYYPKKIRITFLQTTQVQYNNLLSEHTNLNLVSSFLQEDQYLSIPVPAR